MYSLRFKDQGSRNKDLNSEYRILIFVRSTPSGSFDLFYRNDAMDTQSTLRFYNIFFAIFAPSSRLCGKWEWVLCQMIQDPCRMTAWCQFLDPWSLSLEPKMYSSPQFYHFPLNIFRGKSYKKTRNIFHLPCYILY